MIVININRSLLRVIICGFIFWVSIPFSCSSDKDQKKVVDRKVSVDLIVTKFSEKQIYDELMIREEIGNKSQKAYTIPRSDTLKYLTDQMLYVCLVEKQKIVYGVYGPDNRVDIYTIEDSLILKDTRTVVAIFKKNQLRNNNNGTYTMLNTESFAESFGLCSEERFGNQPCVAFCSGFAVGKRLIATAGHCLKSENLRDLYFVFGYTMENENVPNLVFTVDNVYEGVELIDTSFSSPSRNDYGIIKVNKDIPANRIAKIRVSGKIADNDEIYVIGHPSGLPMKYADSAFVRNNRISNYFVTNLDTYGGNSGSPVFNKRTHLVEGILVRGAEDFVDVNDCYKSAICPMLQCRGEDVSRTSQFSRFVRE